ncbi:hypothetical protein T08_9114 [Trichinella sp. T8]|nr:hypothetical protein T08_9114 [Trichinella sp. T8]
MGSEGCGGRIYQPTSVEKQKTRGRVCGEARQYERL